MMTYPQKYCVLVCTIRTLLIGLKSRPHSFNARNITMNFRQDECVCLMLKYSLRVDASKLSSQPNKFNENENENPHYQPIYSIC